MTRVLGIDPGLAIVGFAVLEYENRVDARLVDCGAIRTDAGVALGDRLKTIGEDMDQLLAAHDIEVAVVEQVYFAKNVTTGIAVSHARGVVLERLARAGVELVEFSPPQIKEAVTGYGGADKQQVEHMVLSILKLDYTPQPDDVIDAIACGLALPHAEASLTTSTT